VGLRAGCAENMQTPMGLPTGGAKRGLTRETTRGGTHKL